MEIRHMLSTLGQLFQEKRLASWVPGLSGLSSGLSDAVKNLQAPQGAPVQSQAPAAAPGAIPATAPETPDSMKNRIGETVKRLKEKMKIVTDNPNKYTQGLVDATKEIEAKITDIEKKLNSQEITTAITTLPEEEAKEVLKKFDEELTKIETKEEKDRSQAFGGKNFPDALAENEEAKKLITEKRTELETRRAELKAEEIIDEIIGGMNIQDEAIKNVLKEKVNKDGAAQKEMDDFLAEIGVILDDADKTSLTKQEAEEKIKGATIRLEDPAFTKDGFKGQFEKSLFEPYKPTLTAYGRGVVFGSKLGGGENCKLAMSGFGVAVGELIKADTPPDEETIKKLEEEHTQIILIGHIADVIQESPEKIKSALLFYELGKYESADSPENAEAKAIIDKIMAQKEALKAAGVAIDFLGGTDGTAHGIHTEPEWHQAKVAAFKKLLEFNDAGKITPPLEFTGGERELIMAYETAVDAGKGVDFVKENQDNFLAGGKLFDMALALQRAEDMKKRISGDPSAELSTTDDFVSLDLGTTQNTKTERKSGLKFRAVTVATVAPPDPATVAPPDPATVAPPAPAETKSSLSITGNQLTLEKTKPDGSKETSTYTIDAPAGTTFVPVTVGNQQGIEVTLGGEKATFHIDKDGGHRTYGDLGYNYYIYLDKNTFKIEKRENPEYRYSLTPDGKTLTLNRTKDGKPETLTYTIENPDNLKLESDFSDGDADILVTTADNKGAYIEINPDDNQFASSGHITQTSHEGFFDDYDITLDGTTIKILPKSASAATPAAPANEKILPDSSLAIGTFDPGTGNLTEGKVTHPDGEVDEGKFDKVTGKLIDGTKTFPGQSISEGKFDPTTGFLIEGKVTYPNGVKTGKFDKDTRHLVEGEKRYQDGTVVEGEFDKDTGNPLAGTTKISTDGTVYISSGTEWIEQ